MGVRDAAFRQYDERTDLLDESAAAKQRWFDVLARSSYLPHLGPPDTCRILEIGCNRGYLLRSLAAGGYSRLTGIDLAPRDLAAAQAYTGLDDLHCADAVSFLAGREAGYDAVILKAVLEHVPRDDVSMLLEAIAAALAPGGVVLCEVPNMDWYAAAHERFMDITHETGYTRESLQQLFGLYFVDVDVVRVVDPAHAALATRRRRFVRRAVLGLARRLLRAMGEDAATFWFDCRSILAIARRPR
jgi:2-polyprenyl-3-methyl-5-hydroxy-6-metoxy-1,4-benzoquinol methylase